MPYKSKAQQGFFHSPAAKKAGITPGMVKEWDSASKGSKNLPPHKTNSSTHLNHSQIKSKNGSHK